MISSMLDTRATISTCGQYRYDLRRFWGKGPCVLWIMLNPSTADTTINDRTIQKIMRFTDRWGFKRLAVVNLFALRSTDPQALYTHPDPIGGPLNDAYIRGWAGFCEKTVVAWGNHGEHMGRGEMVAEILRRKGRTPECLKVTGAGQPWHPLYVKETTPLEPWFPELN